VNIDQGRIAAEILRLVDQRGAQKSICPSEVARSLVTETGSDWRPLMGPVRRAAAGLAEGGEIDILRKGRPILPAAMHGVIRLRRRIPGSS
jgi:hypothetical protein